MKKFKFKSKYQYIKISIYIIILVIFSLLSFIKLSNSCNTLINIITTKFSDDNQVLILTKNLDYLINTYSFNDKDNVYSINNST